MLHDFYPLRFLPETNQSNTHHLVTHVNYPIDENEGGRGDSESFAYPLFYALTRKPIVMMIFCAEIANDADSFE